MEHIWEGLKARFYPLYDVKISYGRGTSCLALRFPSQFLLSGLIFLFSGTRDLGSGTTGTVGVVHVLVVRGR